MAQIVVNKTMMYGGPEAWGPEAMPRWAFRAARAGIWAASTDSGCGCQASAPTQARKYCKVPTQLKGTFVC